jgi:Bifunctional DNA primase/polymerase, N-terminal
MSNVLQFRSRTPAQARHVRIVAERFVHVRYTVFPDEDSPFVALQTYSLDDARSSAAEFSKNIIEIGPAAGERIVSAVLTTALALATAGIPVFPIAASKRPTCPHGFLDASCEPSVVRTLWRNHPGPLIGVPTGKVTGLFVLDLDTTRHTDAAEWFERYAPYLPETRQQTSRSGGLHLFFQHVEGLRNSAGRIALGVDTRAEGGSIIVWQPQAWLDRPRPLAEAPQWLLDMAKPKPLPPPPRRIFSPPTNISDVWSMPWLSGLIAAVATARQGKRNAITFWAACVIRDRISAGELDNTAAEHAISALFEASRRSGLSPSEIKATLASSLR